MTQRASPSFGGDNALRHDNQTYTSGCFVQKLTMVYCVM